jgi:hypothetical protein
MCLALAPFLRCDLLQPKADLLSRERSRRQFHTIWGLGIFCVGVTTAIPKKASQASLR